MERSIESDRLNIPAGYVGTSEDVANLVAFLVDRYVLLCILYLSTHSRKVSRYIVGSTIVIDGGSHIVMPLISGNFHDHF